MLGALPLLILQACVIIVAARSIGGLARRVGQPAVIAEVIAGILLGPSLFGRVLPGPFQHLFPKTSMPGLSLLSQVGLVFFMFLIGLELDPKLLRGRGRTSFAISAAGIFVPFVLGALLALQIFGSQAELGVPRLSFVLFMGIAMSITAFPVLARILAERNLIRTELGAIALACAAADDVTAWCLLAVVVSVVHSAGLTSALVITLEAAAFVAFMLFFVRPLLARLSARVTTRENLTQNVVALTFVLLLASAFTSELIGIHALFGAFLFGTIMPRQGDYAHALAERLEDFVVVALLPLFFAYSGLRTQLGLVQGVSNWLLCLGLIAVACAGKFGGSFAVARISGMSTRDSAALGVLMNTRGLMELIVLNVGLDLGVISPKIFTMMVLMALTTTIMTTPLLSLVAPRSFQRASLPDAGSARALRLLLCIGDARMGRPMALLAAACVGHGRPSGSAALHLERPRDRTSGYLGPGVGSAERRPNGLLPAFETATAAELALEFISFDSTDPAHDICEIARSKRSDYVLLGLHRPVLGQNPFGGTVGRVLLESPTAVALLVDRGLSRTFERRAGSARRRRVVAALCGSPHDSSVVRFAEHLLADEAVSVSLVAVGVKLAERRSLAERAQALLAKFPERVTSSDDPRTPQEALAALASDAELLLLGLDSTWGLGLDGVDARATRVLGESSASLLVVHGGALAA